MIHTAALWRATLVRKLEIVSLPPSWAVTKWWTADRLRSS